MKIVFLCIVLIFLRFFNQQPTSDKNVQPGKALLSYYYKRGELLYRNSCANCHKLYDDFTGPGMAGTEERIPGRQWLYDFIKSPSAMLLRNEPYTRKLFEKYKPTIMPSFPQLKKSDINAIYAYAEYEVSLRGKKK